MLTNTLLVLNGKGGVLKTTIAAQIAGLAAHSGWRVLAVDLDQQGNLARDLGYIDRSDNGAGLLSAVVNNTALHPIADVRPGLDVIAGGTELNKMYRHLAIESPVKGFKAIERALRPLAPDYQLIVIDSPPGGEILHLHAMTSARAVIVPSQADQGSLDGLATVFATLADVLDGPNPHIAVLGVALGPLPSTSTKMRAEVTARLNEMTRGRVHVFSTMVRSAPKIAVYCRQHGRLVHEYEADAAAAPPWYNVPKAERRSFSTAAAGLAGDYQALVTEILAAFANLTVLS